MTDVPASAEAGGSPRPGRPPPPDRRGINWTAFAIQALLTAVILWLAWVAVGNVAENMRARNIPTNFDFLGATAGFDINQTLISYSATSTYARAFLVGLINTLCVAALGIILATIIGFLVGIARLSQNWLLSKLAATYVEAIRNTPLLLQLFFWYTAVLTPLPGPRQSIAFPAFTLGLPSMDTLLACAAAAIVAGGAIFFARNAQKGSAARAGAYALAGLFIAVFVACLLFGLRLAGMASAHGLLHIHDGAYAFVNNRGVFMPALSLGETGYWLLVVLVAGLIGAMGFSFWARLQREESGRIYPVGWIGAAMVVLPLVVTFWAGSGATSVDYPVLKGFNFSGGLRVYPEFVALLLGLSLYTASFIAEIVRAGILSVSRGQSEAAEALGLRRGQAMRLVIVPQAMRVIIPPLTNQYLNLTKNSSLAVFIGFPELVQVFVGTVLNQTGAMIQIVSIAMGVYLVISLATSLVMNEFNRRMALVER